jgi:nucleoside transporter
MDISCFELLAQGGIVDGLSNFVSFVTEHWRFCLLHLLQFAIWGAWMVVLGNMLNARGFSRGEIGWIYATMPIGSMIAPLIMAVLADKYFNTEMLIGASHLIGAVLLFVMAKQTKAMPFFWAALAYAIVYSPTLNLANSIVFAHDGDIFGGKAEEVFPWIRVFGTIGWIVAGLSHAFILKKNEPINERPLLLGAVLSLALGIYAFTLPATPPAGIEKADTAVAAEVQTSDETVKEEVGIVSGSMTMLKSNPVFFGVTFVAAIAMGLYFAFSALFVEQSGVSARVVGPVMTIGQWIEIFFMLSLPWFLGTDNKYMNYVLMAGITAWALRFLLFSIGKPIGLVLAGVAIHGICFDFFFAAGFINANSIAPEGLTATAQQFYGFMVYGLGMFLGSLIAGWLNQLFTKPGENAEESVTNWRMFWMIPFVAVAISAVWFWMSLDNGQVAPDPAPTDTAPALTRAGEVEHLHVVQSDFFLNDEVLFDNASPLVEGSSIDV